MVSIPANSGLVRWVRRILRKSSTQIDHNDQKIRSFALPEQAGAHEWEGHLLNPFDNWRQEASRNVFPSRNALLMTYFLPCVSFGETQRRAFGKSALRAAIAFGTLIVLRYLHRILQYSLRANDCLAVPLGPHRERKSQTGPWFRDAPSPLWDVLTHAAKPFGAPIAADKVDSELCVRLTSTGLALNLAFVAYGIFVFIWGARLRTQMREKFGIEGAAWKDVLAWFCCMPCAMCQEARTMAANNVEGGVWHGPGAAPPVPAAAVTEAPFVPVMTAVKVQQQCENGDRKSAAAAPPKPDGGT